MEKYIEVVPAYGRRFKTLKEAKASWVEGMDFNIPATGQYVNKFEAERYDLNVVTRYGIYLEKVGTLR